MRFVGVGLLLVCAWPTLASAQSTAEIDKIVDTMVRLCVGGGSAQATSGTGSGGADLSLRSLDVKGNLKGEFTVSRSSAEGLVHGLDNALGQFAADQADKVRACLQPVRNRLLDVMLPAKQGSAGQTMPLQLASFTIDTDISRYSVYRYDKQKPMYPSGASITQEPSGKYLFMDREFADLDQLKLYELHVRRSTNFYLFSWLAQINMTPNDVPLAFVDSQYTDSREHVNRTKTRYPYLLISVANNGVEPAVASMIRCIVRKVVPTAGIGRERSEILQPLGKYTIKMAAEPDTYSTEIVPALKIAPADAATIALRLIPLSQRQYPIEKVLVAHISIVFASAEVTTPEFLMTFQE